MDDQYYYLLDGKEHGPFSRAAIVSLSESRAIEGAFFRANPKSPWRSAEELGLNTRSPELALTDDLSGIQFRKSKVEKSSNTAWISVLMLSIAAACTGWWLTHSHSQLGEPSLAIGQNDDENKIKIGTPIAIEGLEIANIKRGTWELSFEKNVPLIRDGAFLLDYMSSESTMAGSTTEYLLVKGKKYPLRENGNDYFFKLNVDSRDGDYRGDECILFDYTWVTEAVSPPIAGMPIPAFRTVSLISDGLCKARHEIKQIDIPDLPNVLHVDKDIKPGGFYFLHLSTVTTATSDDVSSPSPGHFARLFSAPELTPIAAPMTSPESKSVEMAGGNEVSAVTTQAAPDPGIEPVSETQDQTSFDHRVTSGIQDLADVLRIAKSIGLGNLTPVAFETGNCSCALRANELKVSASDSVFLYKGNAGSYVISHYWEDNRGNPYSMFYRFEKGKWVDVGEDVLPDSIYVSDGRDIRSTTEGITVDPEGDAVSAKYVYYQGKFQLASSAHPEQSDSSGSNHESSDALTLISKPIPYSLRTVAFNGTVVLKLSVSPNGDVTGVRVEQSSRIRDLDRAATAAARLWKFGPTQSGGEAIVPVTVGGPGQEGSNE